MGRSIVFLQDQVHSETLANCKDLPLQLPTVGALPLNPKDPAGSMEFTIVKEVSLNLTIYSGLPIDPVRSNVVVPMNPSNPPSCVMFHWILQSIPASGSSRIQ